MDRQAELDAKAKKITQDLQRAERQHQLAQLAQLDARALADLLLPIGSEISPR
jgi:hypothetical protein